MKGFTTSGAPLSKTPSDPPRIVASLLVVTVVRGGLTPQVAAQLKDGRGGDTKSCLLSVTTAVQHQVMGISFEHLLALVWHARGPRDRIFGRSKKVAALLLVSWRSNKHNTGTLSLSVT